MSKTIQPTLTKRTYNCPRCGSLCPQEHFYVGLNKTPDSKSLYVNTFGGLTSPLSTEFPWHIVISVCNECSKYTIWENGNMIFPFETELPLPAEDMPEEVKQIYTEAALVFKHSPRASAALLRLAIETLIPLLEGYDIQKRKLNTMIADLVKAGIPDHIAQGLDIVRVYGNDGIHSAATIDLNDSQEDVMFLFELLNIMIDELITRKKKIASLFNKLPQDKLVGIANRDK
jgi:hypothetical protein